MAQLVQCLPCKLKDLSSVPKPVFKTKQEWSGAVTWNSNLKWVETGSLAGYSGLLGNF